MKPKNYLFHCIAVVYWLAGGISGGGEVAAQQLSIGTGTSYYTGVVDSVAGRYYIFKDDSLLLIDINRFEFIERRYLPMPENLPHDRFAPVILKGNLHMVHQGGGWVFRLDSGNWRRIDHSFEHKMQVNSTVFASNDTIYRFGGYGFWSARNFFTWYNESKGEWEALSPKESGIFPPGLFFAMVQTIGDQWYVIEGIAIKESSLYEIQRDGRIWLFDKDRLRWEMLGNLNRDLTGRGIEMQIGNRLMIQNTHLYLIDILNNRIRSFSRHLTTMGMFAFVRFSPFVYRGEIFFARLLSGEDRVILERMPIAEVVNQPCQTYRLYKPAGRWIWWFAGAGGSMLVLALLILLRRMKRVTYLINRDGRMLTYRFRKVELDDKELAVMELLLSKEEATSDEIIGLAGNDQLHSSHNVRIKNSVIEQLNLKFNILLNKPDKLIVSKPSRIDKRIRVYQIRKEYFPANGSSDNHSPRPEK